MTVRCRLRGAWCRWPFDGREGEGAVSADERALVTPDAFPGRFSPLRGFPDALEPLPLVAGTALRRAGWWTPGSGASVPGGLVVGVGRLFVEPMLRFASQVHDRFGNAASPMSFVESHPSTIPSFLGMLYGLSDYQTTVVRGSLSGGFALSHALDALQTKRLARALVVGASEERGGRRVAAALCLDATGHETAGLEVAVDITSKASNERADLLVALARWSERPEPRVVAISDTDAFLDASLTLTVSMEASGGS